VEGGGVDYAEEYGNIEDGGGDDATGESAGLSGVS
jgi:hypothetical protein